MAGILGRQGTRVLFGDSSLDYGTFSGVRANLGAWLDRGATVGAEVGGFLLDKRPGGFSAGSDDAGAPPLAVPV